MSEIADLIAQINAFRDERDWRQFHNPKDLALSISLESAELLELFQWKTSEQAVEKSFAEIGEEAADILIYLLMLIDDLGLDVGQIVRAKLEQTGTKYPVDLARGTSKKYTELR